ERNKAGQLWARANIETIKAQVAETHQLILVSHSMGGAFADGVAEELKRQGLDVDIHVAIAPFQDEFINASQTPTIQFVNEKDNISGNSTGIEGDYVRKFKRQGGSHFLTDFTWIFSNLRQIENKKTSFVIGEPRVLEVIED